VLVGTPIGNLGDLPPRAVEALASADVVYCEDTRHSRKLLTHAGIAGVSLRSLHEHNEDDRIGEVVRAISDGRTVVLVSDAGMPGISDPGSRLVAAVAAAQSKRCLMLTECTELFQAVLVAAAASVAVAALPASTPPTATLMEVAEAMEVSVEMVDQAHMLM
jgi:16S rRNA (cytidine(1402)-2'-O)-methyltransferase